MANNQTNHAAEYPIQLSVLIVSYNSIQTIQPCIESAISAFDSITGEVIVIDNNSTDGTPELLENLNNDHENLNVKLNRANRGFAAGNNQALDLAKGQDIMVLNPDTILPEGVLAGLLSEVSASSKIGMVAPQLQFLYGRILKTCRRFARDKDVIYHSLGLAQLYS